MKKTILGFVFVLICSFALAQPASHRFFIGGDMGFSFSSNSTAINGNSEKTISQIGYTLLPLAGYMISNKLSAGAQLGIAGSTTKYLANLNGEIDKSFMFYASPFVRYYLISGTGGIFAEAIVNFGTGTDKTNFDISTLNTKNNITSISAGISPGIYYFITPKISLEAKIGWLGYQTEITKHSDNSKSVDSEFGFNLDPDFFYFGVIFLL